MLKAILKTRLRVNDGKLKVVKGKTPHLKKEYGSYRYSKHGDGQPAPRQKDHAITTLRYMCESVKPRKVKKKTFNPRRINTGSATKMLGRTGYARKRKQYD